MSKLQILLERAVSADPAEQEDAWAELSRLVLLFVRGRISDRDRAALESGDVVQSVIASFVRDRREGRIVLEDEARLRGYLRQLVAHKLIDGHRRREARGGDQADVVDPSRLAESPEVGARDPSASTNAEEREDDDRIRAALDERDYRLWSLRARGASWSEAGHEIGLTPDAARMRFGRIRETLRARLGLVDDAGD